MQPTRSEINRANAQHSTGPRTEAGKARAAQNSFRHGLFSKQLILPGENPYEFDALRSALRAEHQPYNTVEEILVDELAQAFWRIRRVRAFEANLWQSEDEQDMLTRPDWAALILRATAAAERSFHKALSTLSQLRKQAGLPLTPACSPNDHTHVGFVPQNVSQPPVPLPVIEPEVAPATASVAPRPAAFGFVSQNAPSSCHRLSLTHLSDEHDFTSRREQDLEIGIDEEDTELFAA